MSAKGQVEFIAVVVFLILIVVVAYTALIKPEDKTTTPTAIKSKMMMVEKYFEGLSTQVAGEFIRDIEKNGGYENGISTGGNIKFQSTDVPIWQRCSESYIPTKESLEEQLEKNLEAGLKKYGPQASNEIEEGVQFDFSQLEVMAKIKEKEVSLTIYLPTTIGQYKRDDAYNFTYRTDLGTIYNFASDFSKSQGEKRYLEEFLLSTIYLSEEYEEYPALPTMDVFFESGTVFRAGELMTHFMSKSINHSISNILFWEDMRDQINSNMEKGFAINNVEGRKYTDLTDGVSGGIQFLLADNFSVNITEDFQHTCQDKFLERVECSKFIEDSCLTSYNTDYDITYPVVVRVFDRYTGTYFHFAVMASIEEMKPNDC